MSSRELPEDILKEFEEIEQLSRHEDRNVRALALSKEIALRDYCQRLYDVFDAEQQGREEGRRLAREEAIQLGSREATITIAKNMKSHGLSIEQIQLITGLTLEEIISL